MTTNSIKKLFSKIPESTRLLIVCMLLYAPGIALVIYGVYKWGVYDSLMIATFMLLAAISYSAYIYFDIKKAENLEKQSKNRTT